MNDKKEYVEEHTDEDLSPKELRFDNLDQRSEFAQDFISKKADFFERWALILFLAILICLFGSTWFIRYPDIVQTKATLSAFNGPKEIVPLQTGRLIKLLVQNNQSVKQGDVIGWIESTAKSEEVLMLSAQLDSCQNFLTENGPNNLNNILKNHFKDLGPIQPAYQTYITAMQQFNDYWVNGFYLQQKQKTIKDMNTIVDMNASLKKQKQLTEQDNDLSQETYEMNEKLYNEKVISTEEYRQEKSKLLRKQMEIPQINSNILSNESQQRDKLKELEQLNHDFTQQKIVFEQALQTLRSSISDWKRQYVLVAPIDGVIFFVLPIQQRQFVEQGKLLGYVNPPDSKFYIQTFLPQINLGKIDTGMEVQLRFDAYPYEEVGFVKGRLNYISKIGSDSGYSATILLENGLKTNLNNAILYKSGLKASALIITKDMRLAQRLYYGILKSTSPGK